MRYPESSMVVTRGRGEEGKGGQCFLGTELWFCKVKRVLELDEEDDYTTM